MVAKGNWPRLRDSPSHSLTPSVSNLPVVLSNRAFPKCSNGCGTSGCSCAAALFPRVEKLVAACAKADEIFLGILSESTTGVDVVHLKIL